MNENAKTKLDSQHAWCELARKDPPKRSATDRVADFLEIHGIFDEATAREQASRCVQCPEPSCVTGCPLGNPIPEWMLLTAEGRFLEAAAVLHSSINLPEVCAQVCPSERFCEGMCVLSGKAEPVSIGAIEQFLNEYAFSHGTAGADAGSPNGWRVAVVGSGPGGLTCADELSKRGYAVTVFDSDLVPGGLLVNGTPTFRLENSIVQRRIEIARERGVVFRLGVKIGVDRTLQQLQAEFDAVFLGFDARKARLLELPGADLEGVVQALPFIIQKNTGVPLDLEPIDIFGKHVVVLGGGDTALDCLRTALRCGAHEAVCVYRRDQANMPCSQQEYENAVEEGARFVFLAAAVAVLGDARGKVTGLRLVRTALGSSDASGRPEVQFRSGTEFEIKADWVIPALGFDPLPFPLGSDFNGLTMNRWGGLVVDSSQMTSIPGVFAGGDLVQGPSLVVHAVRDARKAAEGIDAYLSAKAVKG